MTAIEDWLLERLIDATVERDSLAEEKRGRVFLEETISALCAKVSKYEAERRTLEQEQQRAAALIIENDRLGVQIDEEAANRRATEDRVREVCKDRSALAVAIYDLINAHGMKTPRYWRAAVNAAEKTIHSIEARGLAVVRDAKQITKHIIKGR
jgi:transcription initiation factor TFIID subunit TAF12